MATVTGLTAERMIAIEAASVVGGSVDSGTGHLLLETHDGTIIDAGYVLGTVVPATTSVQGIVELATNTETATGTDAVRAVTPAGLASVLSGKQASDADLTAIAGLSPIANDILQYISGAWANRTPAQIKTSMSLVQADISGLVAALALLAPLASPSFTGTVTNNGRHVDTPVTVAVSAAHAAIDASLGNVFDVAATANFTLDNPTNPVAGQVIHLRITQDGTGSRVMTLGSKWNLGPNTVTLSTAANKRDHLIAQYRSSADKWDITGFQAGF